MSLLGSYAVALVAPPVSRVFGAEFLQIRQDAAMRPYRIAVRLAETVAPDIR